MFHSKIYQNFFGIRSESWNGNLIKISKVGVKTTQILSFDIDPRWQSRSQNILSYFAFQNYRRTILSTVLTKNWQHKCSSKATHICSCQFMTCHPAWLGLKMLDYSVTQTWWPKYGTQTVCSVYFCLDEYLVTIFISFRQLFLRLISESYPPSLPSVFVAW